MDFLELLRQSLKEDVDFSTIQPALEAYTKAYAEQFTTGLAESKNKILGEKKNLQAEFDSFRDTVTWVEENSLTQETFEDMKNELETLRANASSNGTDLQEKLSERFEAGKKAANKVAQPQIDASNLKIKDLEAKLSKKTDQYVQYRVRNSLTEALNKMRVEHSQYWFNGLLNSVKYEVDENGDHIDISVPTDMGQEIPLKDWINYFPTTEEGKKMIKAPINVGGGALGGSGKNGDKDAPKSVAEQYAAMFNTGNK